MGGRSGTNGVQQHGGGIGNDMMVPPHHIPGTYDFSYVGPIDPMDGYSSAALNSSDPYDQPPPMRAPSRSKMIPLQPVNSLRQKYFDSQLGNKGGYSDDDAGINDGSESSASSDEEDDMHQLMKQESMMKAERRASQISNKSSQRGNKGKDNRKSGKASKSSKGSPKKSQKEGKSQQHDADEPDKVEQIVNRLQQEYQVYRVDRVELDQTGPSPEELAAAAKKKRGELDSAGSNSRDSGVSIGAGSVGSVHTPLGEPTVQQQPSVTPLPPENNSALEQPENLPIANNNSNPGGKKESSERTSKRKSSIKSNKKSSSKVVHHAIETDDGLSRNWKSTPDVSLIDDYDTRISQYRRLSTEQAGGGGILGHDINSSSYHASALGGGDNFMMLHRKPVLAGRRQSLGRPLEELENRQLSVIPQQQQPMRSSRVDYIHQLHHQPHNGYGGVHEQDHFHRVSSMLEMDKVPSRESSAGSGNTYLLHHDSALHHPLSPHMRSSKSTGNLLGVEDPYRPRGNPYLEMMDHPGSPGRRMLHSRLGSHHAMVDLGNSTDDMEFPMTPQSESSSNTLPKQSRHGMMGGRNPKIVPKKIYKGSFREVNGRSKANMSSINAEMFPLDLKPVTSPKHALPAALLQVQASDWETNVDGFRQLVRVARHHPEFIRSDLHNVNMNALRHVMNLRTQVCRSAILFFRELFMNLGKAMEHDSERIAEKLLDKAADTNKFIREDSGKALEALVLNVSPAKALTCLDLFGTRHRNPAVRSMTARMTNKFIDKLGPDRSLSEVPERLLPMLCRFLQEGSLDTRMSAKLAFSALMESPSFDAQLKRHVPADTLRHVQKAMKAITTKS
ncbi:hypothetical protein Ocin01_08221 [Orchesella cincta]|uniref:TOG domain-containing protein n=1 Tax=Orchesella cincta TaxID=48709 RepID=A0A1D2MZT1_ORCCI|nr:hypothetical protein Ocin01_08221 [Orchesella cincta]